MRCPDCMGAMLNTPRIQVQLNRRSSESLPFKVCRRCKIIIIITGTKGVSGWRLWNGEFHNLVAVK